MTKLWTSPPGAATTDASSRLSCLYAAIPPACLVYGFKHARHGPVARPRRMSSPLLPALPIIGIFAALGRYLVEEQDEYQSGC